MKLLFSTIVITTTLFLLLPSPAQTATTNYDLITYPDLNFDVTTCNLIDDKQIWFQPKVVHPHDLRRMASRPSEWADSRKMMDVFHFDHSKIRSQYQTNPVALTQEELQTIINLLETDNIKIAYDSPHERFIRCGSRKDELTKAMDLLDIIHQNGGQVEYYSLQSSLQLKETTFNRLCKGQPKPDDLGGGIWQHHSEYTLTMKIEDIVGSLIAIHAKYPNIKFGLIDSLPALPTTKDDNYKNAYIQLINALAEHSLELDFIHTDAPWENLSDQVDAYSYPEVLEVRDFVKNTLNLKYGHNFNSVRGGQISDLTFYTRVLDVYKQFRENQIELDDYWLTSFHPFPKSILPENITSNTVYPEMRVFRDLGANIYNDYCQEITTPVTLADYTVWANHYQQTQSGQENGDFNQDNLVNGVDYTIWLANYQP